MSAIVLKPKSSVFVNSCHQFGPGGRSQPNRGEFLTHIEKRVLQLLAPLAIAALGIAVSWVGVITGNPILIRGGCFTTHGGIADFIVVLIVEDGGGSQVPGRLELLLGTNFQILGAYQDIKHAIMDLGVSHNQIKRIHPTY